MSPHTKTGETKTVENTEIRKSKIEDSHWTTVVILYPRSSILKISAPLREIHFEFNVESVRLNHRH